MDEFFTLGFMLVAAASAAFVGLTNEPVMAQARKRTKLERLFGVDLRDPVAQRAYLGTQGAALVAILAIVLLYGQYLRG